MDTNQLSAADAATTPSHPSDGGENSPTKSRIEPLNLIGAPASGHGALLVPFHRAVPEAGAPIHGQGRREEVRFVPTAPSHWIRPADQVFLLLLAMLCVSPARAASETTAADFFVATNGNDNWSGHQA